MGRGFRHHPQGRLERLTQSGRERERALPEVSAIFYRSEMLLGLKRNFQVMAGAPWLELLPQRVADWQERPVD